MIIDNNIFEKLPDGEHFRTVTTRVQRMHDPMKAELTFICVKGTADDWAIYCHFSHRSALFILQQGDKVKSEDIIRNICPCSDEVFKKYRY